MSWHMLLVASLLSRKPGFYPMPVYVGFLVDVVALGRALL
jgi:hypothetical protein